MFHFQHNSPTVLPLKRVRLNGVRVIDLQIVLVFWESLFVKQVEVGYLQLVSTKTPAPVAGGSAGDSSYRWNSSLHTRILKSIGLRAVMIRLCVVETGHRITEGNSQMQGRLNALQHYKYFSLRIFNHVDCNIMYSY